jgi:hypothetical protein
MGLVASTHLWSSAILVLWSALVGNKAAGAVPGSKTKKIRRKKINLIIFARVPVKKWVFWHFFELCESLQVSFFCHFLHDEKDVVAQNSI